MKISKIKATCAALAAAMLLSGCALSARAETPAKPEASQASIAETMPHEPPSPEPTQTTQNPANQEAEALVSEFASLYFAKDREGMKAYLTDNFVSLIDVSPYAEGDVTIHAVKLPQSVTYELAANGRCQASVEFWDAPGSDSYTYLSIQLVQEGDQWKVESYGLEK